MSDQSMFDMMARFADGLTVAPTDGDNAVTPAGEPYVTFSLQTTVTSRGDCVPHNFEDELIAALGGVLMKYKADANGKYLRWRTRPKLEESGNLLLIRCRVVISNFIETIYDIAKDGAAPPAPAPVAPPPATLAQHTPISEICRPVLMLPWISGYLGQSGKFYDEYGKPMEQGPMTWRPNP